MKQSLLWKVCSWEVMATVAQKVSRDVATAAEPETVNAWMYSPTHEKEAKAERTRRDRQVESGIILMSGRKVNLLDWCIAGSNQPRRIRTGRSMTQLLSRRALLGVDGVTGRSVWT
jgi:hypothetical protein